LRLANAIPELSVGRDEAAIAVEDGGHEGKVVDVAIRCLAEVYVGSRPRGSHINFRLGLVNHYELNVDLSGNCLHLVLGEDGILKIILFLCGQVIFLSGSEVAFTRLHRKALGGSQRNLQRVVGAVVLQILR